MEFTIKGMFWGAGDKVFIDVKGDNGSYEVVCLNELLRKSIKENTIVTITVEVEENGNEALD